MVVEMKTVIRSAIPEDIPFIYSTWLKSYRYDSALGKDCRNTVYYEEYKHVLDGILNDPETTIYVMTAADSPSLIFSYIVTNGLTLHYAYTKEDFRRFGLVRRLVEGATASLMPPTPLQTSCQTPPQPHGTDFAPPASSVPAPSLANSEPSPNGNRPIVYICTHKTFNSREIFANHPESLIYNPFSLYKGANNDD